MASTSPSSSREETPLTKYYNALFMMAVDDIRKRTDNRENMLSPIFTSYDDPHHTSFGLKLGFGKKKTNKLEVRILPTNRDVRAFRYSAAIYDGAMGRLNQVSEVFEGGKLMKCGTLSGWGDMYTVPFANVGDIRVLFEIEYCLVDDGVFEDIGQRGSLPPHLDALSKKLSTAMENHHGDADITVIVGNEMFKCHKVVLFARSSYFRGLFESGMRESRDNTITISDITPGLFYHVLKFLYSGQLPPHLSELAFELLPFTEKYAWDELKAACEVAIQSTIAKENVIRTIVLADRYHCPNLYRHCIPIFKKHAEELQENDEEWQSLIEPELLQRLLLSCCEKESLTSSTSTRSRSSSRDGANVMYTDCARLGHFMQLSTDMGGMFGDKTIDEGGFADVVLTLENDEKVPVHRSILLARSGVFREWLIDPGVKEKRISGPPALVKEVIKYFYSGMPPEDLESIAMELLPVAYQYVAGKLRQICVHALRRILTMDNLVDILILSETNECPELFSFCLPFYKANAKRLKPDDKKKLKANPGLLLRLAEGCAE